MLHEPRSESIDARASIRRAHTNAAINTPSRVDNPALDLADPQTRAIVIGVSVAVGLVLLVTSAVLLADVVHVFLMVRFYHRPRANRDRVRAYRERMERAYTGEDDGKSPFSHVVTDEEFEDSIRQFEEEMDKKGALGSIFGSLSDAYCKLLRESIGVVIAPRAVLLQVAHPYVAVGIKQHSNVIRDTPKRFEKTYFHMFSMAFGTREQAIKSARTLRRIHNRVLGTFPQQIGTKLPPGTSYNAAHTHAMLWVGLSLAESVMFGYEALVGRFTEDERCELARDAAFGMMLMGVPRAVASGTPEDFRVAVEACWESDIITVSEEAKFIAKHLLYPTKCYLRPVFAVARYATLVILPPKLAVQFFGREANILDHLLVSVAGGLLRFLYRLLPGPLRYVPEYSQAVRRHAGHAYCCCDCLAKCMEKHMACVKDTFLAMVLPKPSAPVAATATATEPSQSVGLVGQQAAVVAAAGV